MSRPTGLGRGLDDLIPESSAVPIELVGENTLKNNETYSRYIDIPVESLSPNRLQPRTDFDDERLDELIRSVEAVGVLQPVLVRQSRDGYEIVAGERRWRAARQVGLATIPAIVRTTDDRTALEHAVIENLHRDDLNPLEEAQAYHRLTDEFEMTQQEVAERVGRSRPAVANSLRLLGLPDSIQGMLRDDILSAGHGRALAGLNDRQVQETVADRIRDEGLSVRQTEDLVRDLDQPVNTPVITAMPELNRDAGLLEVERLLSTRLDTTVRVTTRGRRGKIMVAFADRDDLGRIFNLLNL
ncbi:MAG: ParB/RepB/Spo0J family partition protein [Acidimicrobiales bacterium]|nr:ParB/RepB/Spo0J family partition protein [Acidimicrobiales bacterium]